MKGLSVSEALCKRGKLADRFEQTRNKKGFSYLAVTESAFPTIHQKYLESNVKLTVQLQKLIQTNMQIHTFKGMKKKIGSESN